MIKAVVLDIDGVIVGTKKGVNFPHPSKKISEILRKINESGTPVVFITAKTSFAASGNIKHVGIDSLHVSDGGAVIFNPVKDKIISIHPLSKENVNKILSITGNDILVNLFTLDNYFIAKNLKENKRFSDFIKRYNEFMERIPVVANDLKEVSGKEKIIKANIVALDDQERSKITELITNAHIDISFKWTGNPHIAPTQIMSITSFGISKRESIKKVAQNLGVYLDEMLGVGDTIQDWDFLEICGYKATLANGTKELKDKFDFSNKRQFMGKHVDEDGLIDIFKHFKLI
ncbi:MAG: HAD family hydrolase [bacterium]|nr:HAD family hydrolase [bacterium]